MDTIEEKTPQGYVLKIYVNKNTFLVFDQKGKSIYADQASLKVMHKIPKIAFLGQLFSVRNRTRPDYNLYKVSKGKIVLPYYLADDKDRRYLLLDTDEKIDMLPIKLIFISTIRELIFQLDEGLNPEAIVVDLSITENDIVIIRNRFSTAKIIITERSSVAGISKHRKAGEIEKESVRAVDIIDEINLNMMSENPVFLARIHLRDMNISKVRQLLLDFDLSSVDADYIVTFINSIIKKHGSDDDSRRAVNMLQELVNDFKFYIAILNNDEDKVQESIDQITEIHVISSFQTYIAKVKSLLEDDDVNLKLVDYENMLFEKKEQLTK
jgi:hypothetical protein